MENTQVVFDKDDYRYMKQAITQAKKAYKLNEVPIGCVIAVSYTHLTLPTT